MPIRSVIRVLTLTAIAVVVVAAAQGPTPSNRHPEYSVTIPGTASSGAPLLTRPARALIGWLPDEQAQQMLVGARADVQPSAENRLLAESARSAVAARVETTGNGKVISEVGDVLDEHIVALKGSSGAKAYFDEGWRVALADLRMVRALQAHVFIDHAKERTDGVIANDLTSMAKISLPLPKEPQLPAQFDPIQKAWIIAGADPNLKIVGQFAGPVQPGLMGFGFAVALMPSFIQVAEVESHFVLRDGYHRAVGFLMQGISHVPVFFRKYPPHADLGLGPGLLPPTVYLGDRPPMLPDYLDSTVSADVSLPAFQKMIIIHGLELTPAG